MRLYLVRHGAVNVRRERPSPSWHLSPEGRDAVETLAEEPYWAGVRGLHTSLEPKAVATAQRIAARHEQLLRIDRDLREVERPWVGDGYRGVVRRYLAGETVEGWEPRDAALARVRACIDAIVSRHSEMDVGIVSHGLALTLYLSDMLDLDADGAYRLWEGIGFPDVAVVDPGARRLERPFRG